MINQKRINELTNQISAFSKTEYAREEVLPELLKLQRQLVEVLFNETHADLAGLKIQDIKKHLIQLNEAKGNPADHELSKVIEHLNNISNLISGEITGNAGEKKAFWALQKVRGIKLLMKNVEFTTENHRTELDAILFTPKAIFVIEVKNPRKSIVIDERGNYCRVSNTLVFDKNIGEKMSDKIHLLREALHDTELARINIESIVVFTNNDIDVENRFPYIRTCFLSELPYLIENYEGGLLYSDNDLNQMSQMVNDAACKEAYPVPFDVDTFKYEFASLIAKLEEDDATEDIKEEKEMSNDTNVNPRYSIDVRKTDKNAVDVASSVIGLIIGIAAAFIIKKIRN